MAYKSYASGGQFKAVDFTDDSQRILRQGDQLLQQQQALSEYKNKQTAVLLNNLSAEFQKSKASRDEAFKIQQENIESLYRIQEREGQLNLQAARERESAAKQAERARMEAFAQFSQTAGKLVAEDKLKFEEEMKAYAQVVAQTQQMMTGPGGEPSEEMGLQAERGTADNANVSSNVAKQVAKAQGVSLSGLRFNLYGGEGYVNRLIKEAQLQNTANRWKTALNEHRIKGTEVTVTLNGKEQTIPFNDPRLQRDGVAWREAANQLQLQYINQNGFKDIDPKAVSTAYQTMGAVQQEMYANIQRKELKDLEDGQQEAVKQSFLAKPNPQISDLAALETQLQSQLGLSAGKEAFELFAKGLGEKYDDVINAYGDTVSPTGAKRSDDPRWLAVETERVNRTEAAKNKRKQEASLQLKEMADDMLEAAATKGNGYISIAERDLIYKNFEDNYGEGLSADLKQEFRTYLDNRVGDENKFTREKTDGMVLEMIEKGTLTREQLDEEYMGTMTKDGYALALKKLTETNNEGVLINTPLPENMQRDDIKKDLNDALRLVLGADDYNKAPHDSLAGALRYAQDEYEARFRQYSSKPGISANEAAQQALNDVRVQISKGEGAYGVFSAREGAKDGNSFFRAFTPGNHKGAPPALDQESKQKEVQEVKSNPALFKERVYLDPSELRAIDSAITANKNTVPTVQMSNWARELGITTDEVINQQLEAAGYKTKLSDAAPYNFVRDNTIDPGLVELLDKHPTQNGWYTATQMTTNQDDQVNIRTPRSGNQGFQDVFMQAQRKGSALPELVAAAWYAQTDGGTDKSNEFQTLLNDFLADTTNVTTMGELDISNMTYRQIADTHPGLFPPEIVRPLESFGFMDKKPNTHNFGVSPTTDETMQRVHFYTTGTLTNGGYSEHTDVKQGDDPNTPENEFGTYFPEDDKILMDSVIVMDPEFGETNLASINKKLYNGNTPSGMRYGASRSYGTHRGWDYGTKDKSKLKLTNGAIKIKDEYVAGNGWRTTIKLKDGRYFEFLHGDKAQ